MRNAWLLVVSYYFYMNWNAKYALLLAGSTLVTFVCSLLVSHFFERGKTAAAKWSLAGSFVINIGILFVFKYSVFFADNVNLTLPSGDEGGFVCFFESVSGSLYFNGTKYSSGFGHGERRSEFSIETVSGSARIDLQD